MSCNSKGFAASCLSDFFPAVLAFLGFVVPAIAAPHPDPLPIPGAEAAAEAEMKPYAEAIEHTTAKIELLPIPGGTFVIGSPDSEEAARTTKGRSTKSKSRPSG
jgi:hypothetical protein